MTTVPIHISSALPVNVTTPTTTVEQTSSIGTTLEQVYTTSMPYRPTSVVMTSYTSEKGNVKTFNRHITLCSVKGQTYGCHRDLVDRKYRISQMTMAILLFT
jgi:hypothetical protein